MEKMPSLVKLMPVYEYAELNMLRGCLLPRFEVRHPSWIISMNVLVDLLEIAKEGAWRGSDHNIRFAGMKQFPRLPSMRFQLEVPPGTQIQ